MRGGGEGGRGRGEGEGCGDRCIYVYVYIRSDRIKGVMYIGLGLFEALICMDVPRCLIDQAIIPRRLHTRVDPINIQDAHIYKHSKTLIYVHIY